MTLSNSVKHRFEAKINKTDSCWLWTGALNADGYGQLSIGGRDNQVKIRAHRISYAINIGPIPGDMLVLHKCDVRSCVNPDHLFLGSHQDNMTDMVQKGRSAVVNGFAKLTTEQVIDIRTSVKPLSYFARKFGISKSTVSYVKNGRTWVNAGSRLIPANAG